MSTLQRGILKYYNDGKFFQRIEEAQTPEELDSIYNELNADWDKEVVPISQDILDLFVYNKHIGKALFKKVADRLSFAILDFINEIYKNLEQYDSIELTDLLSLEVLLYPENYEEFFNYILRENYKRSELILIVINNPGFSFDEKLIRLFWEERNQIVDNEEKKLFIKKILTQENISKDILLEALEEFKNDIDIVVEVFVNGIEYPEIFSKVLEKFDKDVLLEKIKSDVISTEEEIDLYYPPALHKIMSIARIADDCILKKILQIECDEFDAKELFDSQDEAEILGEPNIPLMIEETWDKILLSIAKNPNASLDTLKYIVQSTNDIEILYYCMENSGRNLEIIELIAKNEITPVPEKLKNNEALACFDNEIRLEVEILILSKALDFNSKKLTSMYKHDKSLLEHLGIEAIIAGKLYERHFADRVMRSFYYEVIGACLNTEKHGKDVGLLMDKIRENLNELDFDKISLKLYTSENFKDLESKEQAYFECLVRHGLVNEEEVKDFLKTCLGEEYLRRYVSVVAFFTKRGLDLSQTAKDAPVKR